MKIMIKKFNSDLNQPEVIAMLTSSEFEDTKLEFVLRDGAMLNPEFKNYVISRIPQLKQIYKQSGTFPVYQNKKETWKKWLLDNLDSNWSESPYSYSFYNSKDISWGHKPEGSLRLSDHWNFSSEGAIHCRTEKGQLIDGWAVGQFHNGKYKIIKKFED